MYRLREFKSQESFTLNGKLVFITKLDRKSYDFSDLKGHIVTVNDKQYRVLGVEFFAHNAPWWPGEPIGLMVEESNVSTSQQA